MSRFMIGATLGFMVFLIVAFAARDPLWMEYNAAAAIVSALLAVATKS